MTVYIEYAFLQNFLFDGILLLFSLRVAGAKISRARLVLSATLGATFALVYPFLHLPTVLNFLLKTAVACLMVLTAYGRLKRGKVGGRYALGVVLFFVFTFAFGGAMTYLGAYTVWAVFLSFAFLTGVSLLVLKALQRRRLIKKFIYPCEITFRAKTVKTDGFFDSGNGAEKFGVPVCFLSPDLAFDLFEDAEGTESLCIQTLAGEKQARLYTATLKTYDGRRLIFAGEVYFAPSVNMIGKEYKLLLHRSLIEGESA